LLHEEKYDKHLPIQSISDKKMIISRNELIMYPNKNSAENKYNVELLNTFCVDISKATAKWIDNQTSNALENISLAIKPGNLVAIVGTVGAGKVHNI